jgi:hypothetical protein
LTFNYDTSLEARLRTSLQHIQIIKNPDIDSFLAGSRVNHIYGKLRSFTHRPEHWAAQGQNPFVDRGPDDRSMFRLRFSELIEDIYNAAADLKVIDPHNKNSDYESIQIARMQISNAKRVFVLGYGFDESNNDRLELADNLRKPKKQVFFTNFNNNGNVNKRVSRLLTGSEKYFRDGASVLDDLYERSARNVYDAFAQDFDL